MRYNNFSGSVSVLLSSLALLLVASCTVIEEGPRPRPPWQDRPTACTFEHAPVCGERRGDRETFSNACLARSQGFRVLHPGECRRGGNRPPPQAQFCTREYAPVCARRGSSFRTFSNRCEADRADFRVVRRGPC